MGLFLTLLTLPVSGPVGGTIWIAEQVQAAAERDYYDEASIRQELMELEYRYEVGELTEDEFDEAADPLLERLMMAAEPEDAHDDGSYYVVDEE